LPGTECASIATSELKTASGGDLIDEGRFSVPCPETSLTVTEVYEGLEQGYRHKPSAKT
jgi:hypothetical protein